MKALITSLALALMFAAGSVSATSDSSFGDGTGCGHQTKWEDT